MTFSSSRHPALAYWWSMTPAFAGAGLFRKPVPTPAPGRLFRDHALNQRSRPSRLSFLVFGDHLYKTHGHLLDVGSRQRLGERSEFGRLLDDQFELHARVVCR